MASIRPTTPLPRLGHGLLDRLQLDLDVDPIGDEHATRLERLVPGEAEVLAVDRGRGREADALVAPRVLALAAVLGVEDDLPRDVTDGEVADDAQALGRDDL